MLNRRDKQLAKEIAFQIRHPPQSSPSIGYPGSLTLFWFLICAPITVYLYTQWHWIFSLPTGIFIVVLPMLHAGWRLNFEDKKSIHTLFLLLYAAFYILCITVLKDDGHKILALAPLFFGVFTIAFLIKAIAIKK